MDQQFPVNVTLKAFFNCFRLKGKCLQSKIVFDFNLMLNSDDSDQAEEQLQQVRF